MHLVPVSFYTQLMKEEILQYWKGLIVSIKNNHVLIEQSFHSAPLRDKDVEHHISQPEKFVYWKRHLQNNSLQSCWKGPYQVLLTKPCG